jgi:SPOR domain
VPPPVPKKEDAPRWAPLESDKRIEDVVDDFTPGPAVEETEDEIEAPSPMSSLPPAPAHVRSHEPAAAPPPEPAPPLPPEPEPEHEFADIEEEVGEMIDPELDELAAMSAPYPVRADEHESIEEPLQAAELDEAVEPEYDEESPHHDPEPPRVVPSPHFPGGRRAAEETPPPDFELPETEGTFALPSWLDDLASKNAVVPAASASEPDVAPEPPPPPPPAAPVKPATPVPRAVTAAPTRPVEPVATRPAPLQLDRVPPPRIVPHPGRHVPPDTGRAPNFVGGDSLPPRLRDKLADREERAPKRSGWLVWVALLVVFAAVAFGVIWFSPWSRMSRPAQPRPIAPAVTTPVETPTTSTAASNEPTPAPAPVATPSPSLASNTVASKPVAPKTTKTTKPKRPVTKSPAVVAGPPAPPTFGIVVGTFLNQERANEESASLSSKSSLPAHVQSVTEDGTGVFRVVLGRFDDRAKAEQVASDLVGRGLINEARVTTLGPR